MWMKKNLLEEKTTTKNVCEKMHEKKRGSNDDDSGTRVVNSGISEKKTKVFNNKHLGLKQKKEA